MLDARRLQRADQERRDHRRHAHPRVAADDQATRSSTARGGDPRSHLGRPKGKAEPGVFASPVAARLSELLGRPVAFAEDCVGPAATAAIERAGGRRWSCSRTCASTPRKRRTTRRSPSSSPRSRTSTSTMPSARRTARTPRPRASSTHVEESAAGLLMAAELRVPRTRASRIRSIRSSRSSAARRYRISSR